MTEQELNDLYFEWMFKLVDGSNGYYELLRYLHDVEFVYIIPMDGNRAEDGIDLRYRFGDEHNYSQAMISSYLDNRPCSVFEMMVALALRCEETIMTDPDYGDRTGEWFWTMINSLGLVHMTDKSFSEQYVDRVIGKFLNRKYKKNGEGGLFVVPRSKRDMRSAEIWYQLNWYLDWYIEGVTV